MRRSDKSEIGFNTVVAKAFVGVGASVSTMLLLAAVCAGLCMLMPTPTTLTLPIGVGIFMLSAAVGGALSGRLLSGDRTAALFSGLACGLALMMLAGVSALTQSLLSPETTHKIGMAVAVLIRGAAIPVSAIAAYFVSGRTKIKRRRRR